jgi:RNA polymerase sigma-70 factor (ECF subfamily)
MVDHPDLTALADADLVRLVRSGNVNRPWAELDHRYRPRAVRVARAILRSSSRAVSTTAEEVAHDALTAAHLKLDLYDESRPFWPWLCAIVRHGAVGCLRQNRRRRPGHFPVATRYTSPLDALVEDEMRREAERRLRQAVVSLAPRSRELFHRFYHDSDSVRSLAGAFGLGEQTVRGLLSGAKKCVLAQLGGVRLNNRELKQLLA